MVMFCPNVTLLVLLVLVRLCWWRTLCWYNIVIPTTTKL